jgi:DNA-binding transcriptional regulator YiaG
MAFSDDLRKWRGKLLQKEAADVLKVPLDTYRAWEHGQSEPSEAPNKAEILRRMTENISRATK